MTEMLINIEQSETATEGTRPWIIRIVRTPPTATRTIRRTSNAFRMFGRNTALQELDNHGNESCDKGEYRHDYRNDAPFDCGNQCSYRR